MNETISKAPNRLKTELVPAHFLSAPDNAPACYGSHLTRCYGRVCGGCEFESLCADFIDRKRSCCASGAGDQPDSRIRSVWPVDAPLIFNVDSFRDPWPNLYARPLSLEDCEQFQLLPGGTGVSHSLWEAAYRAHASGLLPLGAVVEIAILADRFRIWLDVAARAPSSVHACALTAKTWCAAEMARRALRFQGRPNAFSVARVHEIWGGLFNDKRSLKSLAATLDRDLGLFREFWSSNRR